jgi:hypothetical protein
MQMSVKLSDRLSVVVEGKDQKDIFKQISELEEIFGINECGACHSNDVYFRVRNVEDNDYHEIACRKCSATLALGQMKKGGGLFPKRKDDEGNWLKNGGWLKWNPQTKQRE